MNLYPYLEYSEVDDHEWTRASGPNPPHKEKLLIKKTLHKLNSLLIHLVDECCEELRSDPPILRKSSTPLADYLRLESLWVSQARPEFSELPELQCFLHQSGTNLDGLLRELYSWVKALNSLENAHGQATPSEDNT